MFLITTYDVKTKQQILNKVEVQHKESVDVVLMAVTDMDFDQRGVFLRDLVDIGSAMYRHKNIDAGYCNVSVGFSPSKEDEC